MDCNITEAKALPDGERFQITFGDGHQLKVSSGNLVQHRNHDASHQRHGVVEIKTWNTTIASRPPTVRYSSLETEGLKDLLQKIRAYGFCFVDDMPATPEATVALLQTIGPIRNTHYGGFYDFTSDLSSKDTAYTSESLEPHTDNTYFTEPAGLQALHLLSHTDGSGGESSLVDGYGAATILYAEDPKAYANLSTTRVHAHASGNDGISIQPAEPVPVLSHHSRTSHLTQVRWNTADRAGVACNHADMEKWYDAAA